MDLITFCSFQLVTWFWFILTCASVNKIWSRYPVSWPFYSVVELQISFLPKGRYRSYFISSPLVLQGFFFLHTDMALGGRGGNLYLRHKKSGPVNVKICVSRTQYSQRVAGLWFPCAEAARADSCLSVVRESPAQRPGEQQLQRRAAAHHMSGAAPGQADSMCWKNPVQGPEASRGTTNLERPCEKSQRQARFCSAAIGIRR